MREWWIILVMLKKPKDSFFLNICPKCPMYLDSVRPIVPFSFLTATKGRRKDVTISSDEPELIFKSLNNESRSISIYANKT